MEQAILDSADDYNSLDKYLDNCGEKHIFLVCGKSFDEMKLSKHLDKLCQQNWRITRFSDFNPNPTYQSVIAGVNAFRKSDAKVIMAVGGGSALDVAKCIKLYRGKMPHEEYPTINCDLQEMPFIAVPTTAGTGSESTRYAVIYRDGEKQSVTDESIIPNAVLFDSSLLASLPLYHREAGMLDALCHGIESFWSVNSTEQSRILSVRAIKDILKNWHSFLANEPEGNANMLRAANLAGKAINITQTTAGHAMAYKLTSFYGIAHGHAVALCVEALWLWMIEHMDECIDNRGKEFLKRNLLTLADLFDVEDITASVDKFRTMLDDLQLKDFYMPLDDISLLTETVNPVRLKNHPVNLKCGDIEKLYENIRRRCRE